VGGLAGRANEPLGGTFATSIQPVPKWHELARVAEDPVASWRGRRTPGASSSLSTRPSPRAPDARAELPAGGWPGLAKSWWGAWP